MIWNVLEMFWNYFFHFAFYTETINNFAINFGGFLKNFSLSYISTIRPLLYVLLLISLTQRYSWFLKYMVFFSLISILSFQINSSIVPIGKKLKHRVKNNHLSPNQWNKFILRKDSFIVDTRKEFEFK